MKITVKRAFLMGGVVQSAGTPLDVPDRLARELIAIGKADPAQPLPAPAGPMTIETVPALVQGKGKKEKHDAGQ